MTKAETKEWKTNFREKICLIKDLMKEKGISFGWGLVGSSKRNLVIKHHNKGFDLDYQLELLKNARDLKTKEIKDAFLDAFNKAWRETDFSPAEDSTSSITIKKVNQSESKIEVGYDVVILKRENDEMSILRHKKGENESYGFEKLEKSKLVPEGVKYIKENKLWDKLRDEYYKQKTEDKSGKKSYQLYIETVNIIYENSKPR